MKNNTLSILSNISASLQISTQLLSQFTPFEDSLQKASFGLGIITDVPSFLSRSQSLKTRSKTEKFESGMQLTANILHYSNLINQFFPTHPFVITIFRYIR